MGSEEVPMSDLGCACDGKKDSTMNGFAVSDSRTPNIRSQHRALIPAPGSCCGLTMGETGDGDRMGVFQPGNRPMGASEPTPAEGLAARKKARARIRGESDTELAFFGGRGRGIAGIGFESGMSGNADWSTTFKADITNKATMAEAMPPGQMARDFVVPLLQSLRGLAPGWTDSGWGIIGPKFDTYQNLIKRLVAVQVKSLGATGVISPEAFKMGDTSIVGNFDKCDSLPAGELQRACREGRAPKLSCNQLPGPVAWVCANPGKSLAIALVLYFSPLLIKKGVAVGRAVRSNPGRRARARARRSRGGR